MRYVLRTLTLTEGSNVKIKKINEEKKADGSDYASRVATGEPLAGMISGRLPLVWAHAQLVYDSPEGYPP